MPAAPPCPACGGLQLWGHPAGWLALDHTNTCELRDAEDSTLMADRDRCRQRYDRPATQTERVLLAGLGLIVPAVLTTHVRWLSSGVRRRTWPTLQTQLIAASRTASAARAHFSSAEA